MLLVLNCISMFQDAKSHISGYISHREQREKQILQCLQEVKGDTYVSEEYIVTAVYKVSLHTRKSLL